MQEIFQTNGRVESMNGMHFYEQDIVMLNYIYTGDVTIEAEIDYSMPGFGFVFASYSIGLSSADEARNAILVKVGSLDFSVYKKSLGTQSRLYDSSCPFSPDKKTHKLKFRKTGTYVYCYEIVKGKEHELGYFNTKTDIDKFYIGVYSNKGNTVKRIDIYDNRPQHWFTSIRNTNGGRISFEQNAFKVENAEKDAEIDQELIFLKRGRYFLDYKEEPVNGDLDKRVFIFNSTEPKIKAPEKTKLKFDELRYGKTPYFDMDMDGYVNILWQIASGRISNIAIKDDHRQDFVATDETIEEKEGSYILLRMKGLKKVSWTGEIEKIPASALTEKIPYSLFSYDGATLDVDTSGVKLNKSYKYVFENVAVDTWKLSIAEDFGKEPRTVYTHTYTSKNQTARIFDAVSAKVTSLTLVKEDGEEIDIINRRSVRKIVPAAVKGPIIVTDSDNIPLDLSASYRVLPNGRIVFTNFEREVFEVEEMLLLNKMASENTDIILYGIRGDIDKSKLYHIRDEAMISDIRDAAPRYDIISGDLFKVQDMQIIMPDDSLLQRGYSSFIVEYLKEDSYCINMSEDGTEYVVDIVTKSPVINTMYDMTEDGRVRAYKVDDKLKPGDNSYLVLRKDELS